MKRWLIRLLIVGVLVGAVVGVSIPAKAWWEAHALPKFITATASRGPVETVVNSTGTVKPVRTVSVGAFTSGPVAEVHVNYNSKVYKERWYRRPTLLARIDPKLAQAAVDSQKAAVESQAAAVESAEADLRRVKALRDQASNSYERAIKLQKIREDYLSPTEMDTYMYNLESLEAQYKLSNASINQAKANLRQAQANLKNADENLGYTQILAPEDGIVIERKVDPGQTVAASFQTPELFTLGVEMDEHMHVYASVDEADMGMIRKAKEQKRPVKFTVDAYPGELFEGHIDEIRMNSTTTQNVVTYPVIIEAENPDLKLMPGMTANLSFQIEFKENVRRIPVAALRFSPLAAQVRPEDRHYVEGAPAASSGDATPKRTAAEKAEQARNRSHRRVWVQDGILLRAVPVTLGLMDNQYAELVEGDLADDQALVAGTENLFPPR